VIVRKLRLQRGWSQDQLAELTGLSVRSIQRFERGEMPGLESRKALAAVYEVDFETFSGGDAMHGNNAHISQRETDALEHVRDIKAFYSQLATYLVVIPGLFLINALTGSGYWWAAWPALGWGIGLCLQALTVFEVFSLFGPQWEQRRVAKRAGRRD